MIDPPDRPLVVMCGLLLVTTLRAGTASQQPGLVLDADDASRWALVKLGGASFGLPDEAVLAGRRVQVSGYPIGSELRFTLIEPL